MEPGRLYTLIQELRRRTVFQEIIVYGASTLILLEAGDIVFESFGRQAVPFWYYIVLGIGFLFSLWFSWYYDITPGGIKKTSSELEHEEPVPSKKLKTYKLTTLISVLIIIGLLSYWIIDNAKTKQIQKLDKSIAVLPYFEEDMNPGQAEILEFTGSEITTRLLKIKEYRVLPWEDTKRFQRGDKTFAAIGQELSVSLLVNWRHYKTESNQYLRVALILAGDNQLLWSENYEIRREWSLEICRRSRQIAKGIYRTLKTPVTRTEWAELNEEPKSSQATMLASLGNSMTYNAWEQVVIRTEFTDESKSGYTDSASFEKAIYYFDQAIAEDPAQAAPYAYRAKARLWGMRAGFFDRDVLGPCELDIIEAFKRDGQSIEAYVALGFYYYYGLSELELALNSFNHVVKLEPENIEYIFYLSRIHSALGNWDKVKQLTDLVYEARPRNARIYNNLAYTYHCVKDFKRAQECFDIAIDLLPYWYAPYFNKSSTLLATGNLSEARDVAIMGEVNTGVSFKRILAEISLFEGDYITAIQEINSVTVADFWNFRENEGFGYLLKAKVYQYADEGKEAASYYSKAVEFLKPQVMLNPEDPLLLSQLGVAYAGLGQKAQAVKIGENALAAINCQTDEMSKANILNNLIRLHNLLGNKTKTIQLKDNLLSMNSFFTETLLRIDPDTKHLFDVDGS